MARRALQIAATLALLIALLAWEKPKAAPPSPRIPLGATFSAPVKTASPKDVPGVDIILADLQDLSDTDQAGLDNLFRRLKEWIQSDPDTAADYFDGQVGVFSRLPLEQSFFLIHGFLNFSPAPERRARVILEANEPRTRSFSHHVGEMTPAERLDRTKAFTLRQFPRTAPEGKALLPDLREVAARSPSLDVAREAVLLIQKLSPRPEQDIEEALRDRPAADRVALNP